MAIAKQPAPQKQTERLPLVPLKEVVVFPHMVLPLIVGRETSLGAIDECLASDRPLFVCTQRDSEVEAPGVKDLYPTGVVVRILQTVRMPDDSLKMVIEGLGRAQVKAVHGANGYDEASLRPIFAPPPAGKRLKALMRLVLEQFEAYARLGQRVSPEVAV
ncbi:MAG: LON peptidase substrate-binding domain-containing protein, partial [Candidatus Hydrogenedentales bacterium]